MKAFLQITHKTNAKLLYQRHLDTIKQALKNKKHSTESAFEYRNFQEICNLKLRWCHFPLIMHIFHTILCDDSLLLLF